MVTSSDPMHYVPLRIRWPTNMAIRVADNIIFKTVIPTRTLLPREKNTSTCIFFHLQWILFCFVIYKQLSKQQLQRELSVLAHTSVNICGDCSKFVPWPLHFMNVAQQTMLSFASVAACITPLMCIKLNWIYSFPKSANLNSSNRRVLINNKKLSM